MLKHYVPYKIKAFTIIELMITLAVAAILLAIAAPNFTDIIKNNRLTTEINELASALNLSRSEAIKRGLTVTTCSSSDSITCSGDWQDGWIVFEDIDGHGDLDTGTDTILQVHGALSTGNTLNFIDDKVTHESSGFAIGFDGIFMLCDDRAEDFGKGLDISNSGRVSSVKIASCS